MLRYKGKFISKKQLGKKIKQIEAGKQRSAKYETDIEETRQDNIVEGNRIVDIPVIAAHLFCTFCKEILSLKDIEKETVRGLASIFHIRCRKCLLMNRVPTSNQHLNPQGSEISFDMNTKAALGCIHAGMGYTSMTNFLRTMDIPGMTNNTYKKHEREIGPVIELVTKNSCEEACEIEKSLTLNNLEKITSTLPDNIDTNFLTPKCLDSYCFRKAEENIVSKESENQYSEQSIINDNHENHVVRICGSYDMGWSTRSTGHQYDSLNGYGHLIGTQSGRVLSYATRNRKCRMCDTGNSKQNHDCRLNYFGSAKAMEADVAVKLIAQNTLLKSNNIEVGVVIGDNDSSSISAIRKVIDHPILKQSDKNHTAKGITNLLYKIEKSKDPDKELTSDNIKYLQRCFTYAISQNKGNVQKMSAAIKNIPYHVFNIHENCGDWCGYNTNPDYNHNTIIGGFKNYILFEELKSIFEKLSANAQNFSMGGSSQANESLNALISKKCPKNICYSQTESADFRVAAAVAQKNKGQQYLQEVCEKYSIRSGSFLKKHIAKTDKLVHQRRLKIKTPSFKYNRRLLKKKRSELKNKKESIEGLTYQSNMELLQQPKNDLIESIHNSDMYNSSSDYAIVFFDIETSGLKKNADILQIAMKYNDKSFNEYIDPTKKIHQKVSEINGLTNEEGNLYFKGVRVLSFPIRLVLRKLLDFLTCIEKPCLLVAHNCNFDASHLLRKIQDAYLVYEFSKVIAGFIDSLKLFRRKYPHRKAKGECTLTNLCKDTMNLSVEGAHDANYDVYLLKALVEFHFEYKNLIENIVPFNTALDSICKNKENDYNINTLQPLNGTISKAMLKKLAMAGVTYNLLESTYKKSEREVIDILEQRVNNKPQLIKKKKILQNILNFLKAT